jgi:formylglycine-generating enzyme required for sulfatase activity
MGDNCNRIIFHDLLRYEKEATMLRKVFCVFILLLCMVALSSCSKKEEKTEAEKATAAESETAQVTPGEMVLIPAGEFIMGSNNTGPKKEFLGAYPEHKVNLKAYWIDKFEVTNLEFLEFASKTGYVGEGAKEGKDWRNFATPDKANCPIVSITWSDANEYCKAQGKRLPTEEEWEKAARGTDGRDYPWGNEFDVNKTNTYEAGFKTPMPIGQNGDVSPFGVQDTFGNVQEWTSTYYTAYPGNTKDDENYHKKWRVVRGSSYSYKAKTAHIWDRSAWADQVVYNYGFRCAKDATPEDAAKATQNKK